MKRLKRIVILLGLLLAIGVVYHQIMMRFGSATPPPMRAASEQADFVLVDKSERILWLKRKDKIIATYEISLGGDPLGHKRQEGDNKTPEGSYVLDWRNQNSIAHLSIHISYPNQADMAQAEQRGVSAGGFIMIHGIANGWGWLGGLHRQWDWTNGCIAVTNKEMREIWSLVPNGTPIEIRA